MGSKNNPSSYDCYDNAEPDEPMFVLLARDMTAPVTVAEWIGHRIGMGLNTESDAQIIEALDCITDIVQWRRANRP